LFFLSNAKRFGFAFVFGGCIFGVKISRKNILSPQAGGYFSAQEIRSV